MRLRPTLTTALTIAALTLTACGTSTDSGDNPATTTIVETTRAATPDDLTDLTFQITWGQAAESERDNLCDALTLLGPEQAAAQMQDGAGGSAELDWDRMAELLGDECAAR